MSQQFKIRNKADNISLLIEKRAVKVNVILVVLALLLFICSLAVGSTFINPIAVVQYLVGLGDGEYSFVLGTLRLPRIILSFFVGICLGVAGLILQGIVRNPLASPDIIGITGGGSVAAVVFLTYFSAYSIHYLPFVAICGAGISSLVIYILAWKKGVSPIRLVLVGIGIQSALGAVVTMLIVIGPTYSTSQAYIWLTGSVYGANWSNVYAMAPWLLIFVPMAMIMSRKLSVQELGDDLSRGLGSNVQLTRLALLGISVALAGSSVAFAGGIGFVGLIAPHIARKLVGRSVESLIPASGLIGGIIVVLADTIARTAFLPLDLPAGVFVSGIGAPFFIYLLYKSRNV